METVQHDVVDHEYLEVALAETFSKPGTADVTPGDKAKLAGLLKHYRGKAHPFAACKRDQMKHGLSEDHANRRCAVIKDLIEGNTRWRKNGGKANLSGEELVTYALDADGEFFAWLSETDADAMIREAEEQREKEGILFRLKNYLGLGPDEEDEDQEDGDADSEEDVGDGESSEEDSEEAEEEVAASTEPEAVSLAYQLPYDLTEPEKISRRLWRKHLLPLGKKISYKGTVLDFSGPTLRGMVESAKRRAFDAVYVTVGHTRDADKGRGVLKDLFIKQDGDPETDGLYGDFELSEEGENIIRDNLGAIGTSVSYHPNYTREADGEKFGPAIQHVAFTPTPHVPGLKPWEAVQMSELETEVVDLTDAEYAAPETESRKESGPEMETRTDENEEGEMEQTISLEEFNALKAELEAERNDRRGIKSTLRNQGINGMLNRMVADKKTTPPKAEAAKVILSALQGAESDVVELSSDGAASVKDDEVGKAMLDLLAPGAIPETGERGMTDLDNDLGDDERIALAAEAYMQEHPGVPYRDAEAIVIGKGA